MSVSDAIQNPGSYVGSKLRLYRTLLFDPKTFYEKYAGNRGILTEVLLVLVIGLVGTAGVFYAVRVVIDPFGGAGGAEIPFSAELQLWGQAVFPLLGAFVLWLGLVGAMYAISWLYTGAGSIFLLLKYTAWSMVPFLFANAIQSIAYFYTAYGADVEGTYSGTQADDIYLSLWEPIGNEPLVLIASTISVVFVVWCGYLAAHAVAAVRNLETSEGYRVVVVPVVAYVLYVLYDVAGVAL